MQRFKILLLSIILMGVGTHVTATSPTYPSDSINVSITLDWNSSVNLTRNQKGQYSGKLYLSTKQTSDTKVYSTSQPIAADTVVKLLQKILDLGLLDIRSSDLKVIDGFRTNFTISRRNEVRKVSLVPGVGSDQNSKKAGNIISFLITELNIRHKLFSYLNTLPAGYYSLGMMPVKVHQLMPVGIKKSSLYLSYEDSFKKNRIDIPLYVIDGKIVEPIDLNKYEQDDIIKTEIIKGAAASALYGLQAAHGAVLLTTKR